MKFLPFQRASTPLPVDVLRFGAMGFSTLGVRCAWCDKVLREPLGFVNLDDPAVWSHGICTRCRRQFDGDAFPLSGNSKPADPR